MGRAYWIPGDSITGTYQAPAIGLEICPVPGIGDIAKLRLGWSVSAGDVTGDDVPDAVLGAPWWYIAGSEIRRGAAFLFDGQDLVDYSGTGCLTVNNARSKFTGEAAYDYAGWSVDADGDLNRDGEQDVLIGAYGSDRGGNLSGAAYIMLSSHGD